MKPTGNEGSTSKWVGYRIASVASIKIWRGFPYRTSSFNLNVN